MTTERSGTLQGNQLLKSGRIIASNDQAYTNAKTNIARRPISLRYIDAFPEAERTLDQRYLSWVGKKEQSRRSSSLVYARQSSYSSLPNVVLT